VPQSLNAQAELKYLALSSCNIMSAQSGKPNVAIVQDSLLGAYQMTTGAFKIKKSQFFNILTKLIINMDNVHDRLKHIASVYKEKGKNYPLYCGKTLFSFLLPMDLLYEKKNLGNIEEPVIKIYRGVLYEGTVNKSTIGSTHGSLIQIIHKEYGKEDAANFIDNVQFATNNWLLVTGFSIGIGDCMIKEENGCTSGSKQQEIKDTVHKYYMEADAIKTTTSHPGIREMRINAALNKAKDVGLRIAKDAMGKNNNFISTVNSGSKGDFVNIAQVTSLLGQQNLNGGRIPLTMNNGRRSLPHYPFKALTSEMEYESRGFIASSFMKGLNPREFYFHAMSGRKGITDTAMGTSATGYMQRRIIKLTEDIMVHHNGMIMDTVGKIYQTAYGGHGIDPACVVKVKGKYEICDISRMVDRLNLEVEIENSS